MARKVVLKIGKMPKGTVPHAAIRKAVDAVFGPTRSARSTKKRSIKGAKTPIFAQV
jgi:hypothetical protein